MHLAQADQFSGSLIGQCLGDALGFPVEGSPPDICASYAEQLRTLGIDHTVARRRNYALGQYTDDSQLARELMLTYAELGRFDPSDYARRIQSIFNENRIVGRGLATDAGARRLIAGVPWDEAGTPSPQAGNGTAMRAGPVGLLFGDDPEQMIQVAHDQGRIPHKDLRRLYIKGCGGKNMSQEKVALVTGVSSGIGRAIAGVLPRHGFRVFGTARGNGGAKRALENVELVHVDVRDEDSVHSCVRAVLDRAGRIDALVNNAGYTLIGSLEETTIEEAKQLFDTNFFGVCE